MDRSTCAFYSSHAQQILQQALASNPQLRQALTQQMQALGQEERTAFLQRIAAQLAQGNLGAGGGLANPVPAPGPPQPMVGVRQPGMGNFAQMGNQPGQMPMMMQNQMVGRPNPQLGPGNMHMGTMPGPPGNLQNVAGLGPLQAQQYLMHQQQRGNDNM